jgi:hypothetical protein
VAATRTLDRSLFRHRRDTGRVEYIGTKVLRTFDGGGIQPGAELSRRQYENLRYQSQGWASKSEYERVTHGHMRNVPHEANAYRRFAQMYADEHDIPLRSVMGPDSEFSKAFKAAYDDDFKDLTPNSPFSDMLTAVGVRDPLATYDVGETP